MGDSYKIGIVAGEISGDQLGAGLICSLKSYYPEAEFVGIGGSKMVEQGFSSLFPLDRLSVMGFIEPIKRLPELLKMRKSLFKYFCDKKFDLVIGIDAPDFNLGLEKKLRNMGIKTAHYVSPSVWAWRQNRIKKIRSSVDLMITLLPFEEDFYKKNNIPVVCVGHPLAEDLALKSGTSEARQKLDLTDDPVLVLMPGSRASEVQKLSKLFIDAAVQCKKKLANLQIIIPAATPERKIQIQKTLKNYLLNDVRILDGDSHLAISAADVVLLSSGTSTLEAMLMRKPMVVSYRLGILTYALISRIVKIKYAALPNLLVDEPLVPEYLEKNATLENIVPAVMNFFDNPDDVIKLKKRYEVIHESLKCGGSDMAAKALVRLLDDK
ncbi:MAG: lipid-A-disaccharide synthase [Porticoccus sp.]|jgi:lipid-A-disaccharide synthase|nr:lipid-A-disaccharide synthase [Porticoccus sp.]